MADIITDKIYGKNVFTWGAGDVVDHGDARERYLNAIKCADGGDIQKLIIFARS